MTCLRESPLELGVDSLTKVNLGVEDEVMPRYVETMKSNTDLSQLLQNLHNHTLTI